MDLSGFDKPGFTNTIALPQQAAAPSGPHFAGGLGGFLERALPAIGSVVGGVGGTLLAPGAGTAVGGAAGGVAGQKLEDLLTGQHTGIGGYAAQAGLGALGGVGKAASAAKGAVNVLRSGEGAAAAGNALRFGTKGAAALAGEGSSGIAQDALTAANANQGTSALRGAVAKGSDTLGKQAMISQTGSLSKGTAQSAMRDIGGLRQLGYSSFDKAAQHAPAITGPDGALTVMRDQITRSPQAQQIDASNFMQVVKDHLANHPSVTPAEQKNIINTATNIAAKHGLAGEGAPGITNAANVQAALKDIGKMNSTNPDTKAALNGIYGDLRTSVNDATSTVPITAEMKNQAINQLRTQGVNNPQVMKAIRGAQNWGDLAQIESKFVTASKAAEDTQLANLRGGVPGLSASGKPTLTGLANQAAGNLAEKGISKATLATSKLAGKAAPSEITSAGQLAGQTAKSLGKTQAVVRGPGIALGTLQGNQPQQPQQAPAQQDLSSVQNLPGFGGPQADQTGTGGSQPQGPFSQENIQRAVMADIAATGGKHISDLMSLYNAFGSPKSQTSQLTTNQQNELTSSMNALNQLQSYSDQLQQAGGGKGMALGPASTLLGRLGLGGKQYAQAQALQSNKADTAAALAAAITGSTRPAASIIKLINDSMPSVNDAPQVAQQKVELLKSRIQQAMQSQATPLTSVLGQ